MSTDGVDTSRRRFLTAATTVVGGVGVVAALVPFVESMSPSARAKALGAPVEVDISKMQLGEQLTVKWRGKPVWIVRRTPKNIADLPKNDPILVDPHSEVPQQPPYCKNEARAIKPEYLVVVGICTHLGCSPTYRPELAPPDLGPNWLGGWLCPCHGSKYDLSARVFQNVPAPKNMVIPPHHYVTDTKILVGVDPEAKGKGEA